VSYTESFSSPVVAACLSMAILLPLLSFIVSFIVAEKYSWAVPFLSSLLLLLSTVAAAVVIINVWNAPTLVLAWPWFNIGGLNFTVSIYVDNLSVMMLLLVTLISFLVHLYSTGYMAGDSDLRRYFGMLGFFTFAMSGIVMSGNLLLTFIFWELVGFSSYMLIGHWHEKPEAAEAARRAFMFNRFADIGFLIALMIVWTMYGTFEIAALTESSAVASSWGTVAALGMLCAVAGKSAQFPFFAWLPRAMEGPTPVSALIHAATMVAAGVFLLARVFILLTAPALEVIIVVGCVTSLAGALAALTQHDIKRILAYSTISQLGLMLMAIGAGSTAAALLHLFTHAFFKAGLFLCAGAIIHTLHQTQHQSNYSFDVQDIRNLGGLRKKLPFTFAVSALCSCALAGLPFFSGFASKEAILDSIIQWTGTGFSWRIFILLSAFAVTFITVLYIFRLMWMVFFGEQKRTKNLHIVEVPPVMRAPMALLAVASLWFVASVNPLNYTGWIHSGLHTGDLFHFPLLAPISAGWVILALVVAYVIRNKTIASPLLHNGFYAEHTINFLIERPVLQLSSLTFRADKKWIDGAIHLMVYIQMIIAHIIGWMDSAFVDGLVNGLAWTTKQVGSLTRSFQGGKIQLYIFWAAFTIIIFIIWTLL
jgi:NADH-quinone oxidoreductase subunit L